MCNRRTIIYLVIMAPLFVLQLLGSLTSCLFAVAFTLLQVRVQVIVLHLHLSRPRLDLRHLEGKDPQIRTVVSFRMTCPA